MGVIVDIGDTKMIRILFGSAAIIGLATIAISVVALHDAPIVNENWTEIRLSYIKQTNITMSFDEKELIATTTCTRYDIHNDLVFPQLFSMTDKDCVTELLLLR